jgi:hypothetical protein
MKTTLEFSSLGICPEIAMESRQNQPCFNDFVLDLPFDHSAEDQGNLYRWDKRCLYFNTMEVCLVPSFHNLCLD